MRTFVLMGALLLACLPAFAQAPLPPRRPVVVVREAPPPVVVYAAPRPVETPVFSIGPRCIRILGFPLVCGR